MENWKAIVGYEGYYEASDLGRVRGVERYVKTKGGGVKLVRSDFLTPHKGRGDYLHVVLCRHGQMKTTKVHKIILEAFDGPCPDGEECRHLSGDRSDNSFKNLKWGTKGENAADKKRHGTAPIGENNPKSKLIPAQVLEIHRRAIGGEPINDIAADFGVSNITVSHIKCGRTWTHITGQTYVRGRALVTSDLPSKIGALKVEGKTLIQIAVMLGISKATAFRQGKVAGGF